MKKTPRSKTPRDPDFDGKVLTVPGTQAPDWFFANRRRIFGGIRGKDIPDTLIDLVEEYRGSEGLPFMQLPFSGSASPTRVRDAIAWYLDRHLAELGDGRGGKVRGQSKLARSVIAEVAYLLLEEAQEPPSPFMLRLVRNLFGVADPDARIYGAWSAAAALVAQDKNASTRDVATMVGVVQGTIANWKKDETFQREVQRLRSFLDSMPGSVKFHIEATKKEAE